MQPYQGIGLAFVQTFHANALPHEAAATTVHTPARAHGRAGLADPWRGELGTAARQYGLKRGIRGLELWHPPQYLDRRMVRLLDFEQGRVERVSHTRAHAYPEPEHGTEDSEYEALSTYGVVVISM
jgi:hypothetical protein